MRRVKIFAGSSHPSLVESICERLGTSPAECELKKFSNGETSVNINTSVRDQDVFIVQSGSPMINDSVMEMLVMISACKGGSAKSITAVMPYFPYSRQSKKKSHRGAITAKLLANLLSVAGIHHVITMDLHAPPTQGFFGKPVDNLRAEPLLARWIKMNVQGWKEAVVVSKNPGGTKRVTSLADALKLNFALITTKPQRMHHTGGSLDGSMFFDKYGPSSTYPTSYDGSDEAKTNGSTENIRSPPRISPRSTLQNVNMAPTSHPRHINIPYNPSPLTNSIRTESTSPPDVRTPVPRDRPIFSDHHISEPPQALDSVEETEDYTDERAREVVTGRLVQGHIVAEDAPSPALSTMSMSNSIPGLPRSGLPTPSIDQDQEDPMEMSFTSTLSRRTTEPGNNAEASDEEEGFEDPELEHTVTLVGNVANRVVLIIDDMIDQCGSWIAAAETVVKRGQAEKVYCIATHGLFGDDSLERMEACECIDWIVVTNSYPIDPDRVRKCRKLVTQDVSHLIAEAIRRNHYGESISALFQHYPD